MSSGTSTDSSAFRPWHLFVLAGLVAATVGVVVVRPQEPAALILLVAAIGAGAGVGYGLYGVLWPLATRDFKDRTQLVAGRARAALEREKTLLLRSIKELEFDRAMGKVSDGDFQEMGGRLRARAISLMKQLDVNLAGHRDLIERELAKLLDVERSLGSTVHVAEHRPVCGHCGVRNESDAKFCKRCGSALEQG